ncbi:hypothetical protein D3C72_2467680 [compost metagenome]
MLPGFLRASSISAAVFCAGTDGCTTSTSGEVPTSTTGAKSLAVSKGSLLYRLGFTGNEVMGMPSV